MAGLPGKVGIPGAPSAEQEELYYQGQEGQTEGVGLKENTLR